MDSQLLVEIERELQKRSQLLIAQQVGAELLDKLDASGLEVTDAFWEYVERDGQWTLYMGMPSVASKGLYETALDLHDVVYHQMSDEERRGLTLSDLSPVRPDSEKVFSMRHRYGTVDNGRGYSISRMDVSPEDPYIYRLNQAAAVASKNGQPVTEGMS